MSFNHESANIQKSWRRQVLEMFCCLLVLICVGNPNFHSFCHLVGQTHQHPTGSIYTHGPNAGVGSAFLNTCDPFIVDGPGFLVSSSGTARSVTSTGDPVGGSPAGYLLTTEKMFAPVPESPYRDPGESDGPFFYIHLVESEACAPPTFELFSDVGPPSLDDIDFECTGISLAVESGTIGARGPPFKPAVCHLFVV